MRLAQDSRAKNDTALSSLRRFAANFCPCTRTLLLAMWSVLQRMPSLYNALSGSQAVKEPLPAIAWHFLGGQTFELYGEEGREALVRLVSSLLWFSYRRGFARLAGCELDSDLGWGCMIRAAQMMLARVVQLLDIGDRADVASLFADQVSPMVPYSLHHIVQVGSLALGRAPGTRFGPLSIGQALAPLVNQHRPGGLFMHVVLDATVYRSELQARRAEPAEALPVVLAHGGEALAGVADEGGPLFLFVPVRLSDKVLPAGFYASIKALFRLPQFVGLVGGRKGAALYFVGTQGDDLFYMDPHKVQDTATLVDDGDAALAGAAADATDLRSFTCTVPRRMPVNTLSASFSLGFLCMTRASADELFLALNEIRTREGVSLFAVLDEAPDPEQVQAAADAQLVRVNGREIGIDDDFEIV